jgi:hypothetical protein
MTPTTYVSAISALTAAPVTTKGNGSTGTGTAGSTGSWFKAMADAWGQALNNQADIISQKSDVIANGGADSPSAITELTTESLKMGFLSQNAQTSISTGGDAFQTLARKS